MTKSEALEASILHWQENVKAETPGEVRLGVSDCALCDLYSPPCADECKGCPVSEKAGDVCCRKTPYSAAYTAWISWKYTNPNSDGDTLLAARDEFRKAAQAEVDFLISLRETE